MYKNEYYSCKKTVELKKKQQKTTEQDEYALVTFPSFHTKLKPRLESAVRAPDWGNENWTGNCTLPRGINAA